MNFVEEENNESSDDMEDFVGEDADVEVERDDNIETGNIECSDNCYLEEIWSWGPSNKKTSKKNVDISEKIHDKNSLLCEENCNPLEAVDTMKVIKSETKAKDK